jgi:competence protein ComEC
VRALRRGGRLLHATLAASLSATLATAPLTALHFSELAPAGVISNAIAIPLTEMAIVPLGLMGALLGAGRSVLGGWLLDATGFLASVLLAFVDAVARVAPVWSVPAPSTIFLIVAAATLAWIAAAPTVRWPRMLVGLAILGAVQGAEAVAGRLRPALEVVFLDVGQGDAAVMLVPGRGAIVIDGGGGRGDPGARVVVPYLRRRGVRRVERLILSHPHPDHSGGVAAVLAQFPVGEIWTNGQETRDPGTLALLAEAGARGVPVRRPRKDRVGDLTLEILGPLDANGDVVADPLASENDNSLVVALSYAGRRVLFAGDIERDAESALLASAPGPIDVLKVPHHGSRTSSTGALLDALRPRVAVASLADGNRYRFPHPDVVARYRARGIRLHRTDTDGAVSLRIDAAGGMTVACARPGACDFR